MQLATARSEEIRQKMKTKEPEIDLWISSSGIPENEKTVVMQQIQYALEHEKDVDFENLLRHLSLYHKDSLRKGNLSLDELRKVGFYKKVLILKDAFSVKWFALFSV